MCKNHLVHVPYLNNPSRKAKSNMQEDSDGPITRAKRNNYKGP